MKKEILPCATASMKLQGIIQSEIREIKLNIVWSHLYGESKKKKKAKYIETENRLVRDGQNDEGGQKVHTSGYKSWDEWKAWWL